MAYIFFFILYAIYKYKCITILELSLFFSHFYIFLRPGFFDYCGRINFALYFPDLEKYNYGITLGIIVFLFFQIGTIFPIIYAKKITKPLLKLPFNKLINIKSIFFILLIIFIIGYFFGITNFNEASGTSGALSIKRPGSQYLYWSISLIGSLLLPASISKAFLYKENRIVNIFISIFTLISLMSFGKRGLIVNAIFITISLLSFQTNLIETIILSLKKLKINKKSANIVGLIIIVSFYVAYIIFKRIVYYFEYLDTESILCVIIRSGGQEFDVLWPAVIEQFKERIHILDLPTAFLGQFIPHSTRVTLPTIFHSLTDKLMLAYNPINYIESKYGVTPNMGQYLFLYFGFLSIPIAYLYGSIARVTTTYWLILYSKNKFFLATAIGLTVNTFTGAIDFKAKYSIFQFVILCFIYLACRCIDSLLKPRSIKNN